ncbi:winged helix-turn-helix transcriptional regulator [Acinetobacter larvae]|uniref:Transcriptional regulator n=1 Tax=Acinetobacter larvae TaxID=1789224 RepID=A0A1B2M062_9GAMM|nr:helix-turn-helix domain-containing protein [Acinetobacter larvae]AOA58570.1 transcriptional regulator [Acinetobacter larvae]
MNRYAKSELLGQVLSSQCPSRMVLEHLTSKWSVLVLHCLMDGVQRFSELRKRIEGVSEKMLAQTLKTLEQDGFVLRTVYPEIPPKVEYQLTFLGAQAAEKLNYFIQWIEMNFPDVVAAQHASQSSLHSNLPSI